MTELRREVSITDTTLRDGMQSPGITLNAEARLRLFSVLDCVGFAQIEAGIPAAGPEEKKLICRMLQERKHTRVAVWSRMKKEDVLHAADCAPDVIHISAPVSDHLISGVLNADRACVRRTLLSCVSLAQEQGVQVSVGFQDAPRAELSYLISLANELKRAGVSHVRLADTVGILTPLLTRRLVRALIENTDMEYGIHAHNDLGMAAAIACEAVKAGVKAVDTTLFGIGERAGNCSSYVFCKVAEQAFSVAPGLSAIQAAMARAEGILFPSGGKEEWAAV